MSRYLASGFLVGFIAGFIVLNLFSYPPLTPEIFKILQQSSNTGSQTVRGGTISAFYGLISVLVGMFGALVGFVVYKMRSLDSARDDKED